MLVFLLLSNLGPIKSCRLIKDRASGHNAGYGFVDFEDSGVFCFSNYCRNFSMYCLKFVIFQLKFCRALERSN